MKFFKIRKKPVEPTLSEPKINVDVPSEPQKDLPFQKRFQLAKMYFLVVIVNENQDSAIGKIVTDGGGSIILSTHGLGTASNDFYDVFGIANTKKRVLFAPIKSSSWVMIKKSLLARFSISDYSKGVAFLLPLSSIIGVSSYKFLSGEKDPKIKEEGSTMEEIAERNDYEMVMAIVNDGFTDLVMDAAKAVGARGGTILTARGTGNKDIEKFFGVVITPEKQIVVILVSRKIKDAVMRAIYKAVGISEKGQGICFSIPVSDVAGVVDDNGEAKSEDVPTDGERKTDGGTI